MTRLHLIAGIWCLAVLLTSVSTDCKRILLLPHSFASHAKQVYLIGEILANEGHEVYMALAESFPQKQLFMDGKVKLIFHESKEVDIYKMGQKQMSELVKTMREYRDFVRFLRINHEVNLHMCTNPLSDRNFHDTLETIGFDLAIVDIFPVARCLLILPYNLDIPFIGFSTMYEPWLSKSPAFPSVIPSNLLGNVYTDHMTFMERLSNFWQNIDWVAFTRVNTLSDQTLKKYFKKKPDISLTELTSKCMLFLIDVDPILDYPRQRMPNEINIGGLTTEPSMPLPTHLQDYMDSAQEGVIIVSFGSASFNLDEKVYKEFTKAFAQIRQNIIWKYNKQQATDLSGNVKLMEWLPQNDILSHHKTKIFITHCGNNGQMEALYHSVPMIGFPIFGDQYYNCKRLTRHGYGICLHQTKFKARHLIDAVNAILSNKTYHKNIKRASNIFKDRYFTPLEHALFWINHVMKYGGKHIHSHALDMPWYEYLMLDIAVFLLMLMIVIVVSICCLVKIIVNHCRLPHLKKD